MSFMGSIRHIMNGSGLENALETIYAKNSIVHIMNGHAYDRSIRAHFLVHIVLTKLILQRYDRPKLFPIHFDINYTQRCEIGSNMQIDVEKFLLNFDECNVPETTAERLMEEIENRFEILMEQSKTSQLWLQY